jgi:hypothetical protein
MPLLDPVPAFEHSFSSSSLPPLRPFALFLCPFREAFFPQQYCSLFLLNVQSSLSILLISSRFLSALALTKSVLPLVVRALCNDPILMLKQYCLTRAFTRQQTLSGL